MCSAYSTANSCRPPTLDPWARNCSQPHLYVVLTQDMASSPAHWRGYIHIGPIHQNHSQSALTIFTKELHLNGRPHGPLHFSLLRWSRPCASHSCSFLLLPYMYQTHQLLQTKRHLKQFSIHLSFKITISICARRHWSLYILAPFVKVIQILNFLSAHISYNTSDLSIIFLLNHQCSKILE